MRCFIIIVISSAFCMVSAKQVCFWDDTVKHWGAESKEAPIGKVGEYSIGVYFNDLSNETIDAANSEYWIRLEMIQKPTDKAVTANLIFEQYGHGPMIHCWCGPRLQVPNEGGVLYYPPFGLLNCGHDKYGFPPVWTSLDHSTDYVTMHMWNGSKMEKMWYDPWGHAYTEGDLEEHTPFTYYTTCYIVPKNERPVFPGYWKKDCPDSWLSRADFENDGVNASRSKRIHSAEDIRSSFRNGLIHVEVPFAGGYKVEIVDSRGRILETMQGKGRTMDIAPANSQAGPVFLRIANKTGVVYSSFISAAR